MERLAQAEGKQKNFSIAPLQGRVDILEGALKDLRAEVEAKARPLEIHTHEVPEPDPGLFNHVHNDLVARIMRIENLLDVRNPRCPGGIHQEIDHLRDMLSDRIGQLNEHGKYIVASQEHLAEIDKRLEQAATKWMNISMWDPEGVQAWQDLKAEAMNLAVGAAPK